MILIRSREDDSAYSLEEINCANEMNGVVELFIESHDPHGVQSVKYGDSPSYKAIVGCEHRDKK